MIMFLVWVGTGSVIAVDSCCDNGVSDSRIGSVGMGCSESGRVVS